MTAVVLRLLCLLAALGAASALFVLHLEKRARAPAVFVLLNMGILAFPVLAPAVLLGIVVYFGVEAILRPGDP